MTTPVTAAMVVIGDEILSGRTRDLNTGFVAEYLTRLGIDLREVRIVGDEREDIIAAVNALRQRYTYVFTSGGIGPTHDDITAEAISEAFGVACIQHPRAMREMAAHYAQMGEEFTESRKRMARTPQGAELINNPVSKAPGFKMENVHVMAGVPKIMQAMMDAVAPTLKTGRKMLSVAVECPVGEGMISTPLADIQKQHPKTMIGSYPRYHDNHHSTQIVVRGHDRNEIDAAVEMVKTMLAQIDDQKTHVNGNK